MKLKYAYILAVTVLIACLALFAACDTTQQVEPPVQYDLSFSVDGEIYRTLKVEADRTIAAPEAPEKQGYIFNGWFFDRDTWTKMLSADSFVNDALSGDVTVYAKYTPVKYAVNYLPNGVLHDSVTEYTIEQQAELKAATREHYDFVGWFTDEACTQQIYEIAQGTTGNLTLYAKFVPTEYKAIFMDGESVVAEVPYTVETQSIKAPAVPEHAGYTGEWEAFELMPGGIKVNAKYTPVDYKITYEGVKATEHKNPAGYNATELPLLLLEATREHYTFVGWYSDAELTKAVTEITAGTVGDLTLYAKFVPTEYKAIFMDGESVVAEIVYTVETESIEAPAVPEHTGFAGKWEKFELTPGGITVKAEYTEIDYTITYEGVMPEEFENPAGYKVTDEAIVLNDAKRQYYKFDGWYTDAEYTNRLTEIATGTVGDLVLYAKWTPVEYTVIYLDGNTVVAEIIYTVETESITDPEIPVHPGYTGAWEAYELVPGGMTVNALYEIITYTVTYENTKDVLHGNPLTYVVTDETVVLADLAKDGYVFEGWYAGDVRVTEIAQGSTGDMVLTAKWTPIVYNIKLHFDPAWGKYAEGIKNPVTFTVEDTVVLEELVCLIPGYVFDGWYTEKNVGEGGEIRELIAHVGDVELYAHFVPKVYTITYVGAEGATNVNPGMYTIESQAINLLPAIKEGYIFGGWYADQGLSVPASLLIPEGSMGDMTLYTKWTPVTYTIEYDADGGVLPENPVVYNITQTLTLQAPTKAGYVFKGWYMAVEQKDDEWGDSEEDTTVTEIRIAQITPGMTGNLKLVARWEPIYYAITYHVYGGENPQMDLQEILNALVGGSISGNPMDILKGNISFYTVEVPKLPLLPASKPGYKFEGWYADPAYSVRQYVIPTDACADIELYAKWSLETYSVTYVLPEGAEHENVDSYTVLDEIKPLNPATKVGYIFEGWYADEDHTVRVENLFGTGVYEDLTLYANFVPKQYYIWLGSDEDNSHTVTFELGGAGESFTQEVTMINGLAFPEIPVRDGYVFAGWFDNEACKGDAFNFAAPVMGDVTLWAKWIETESFIKINAPVEVELNGVIEHKFTFVSLIDTVITVSTSGTLDTCGALYDAKGNVLLRNDDVSSADKNFQIIYQVTAGKEYTISVYGFSNEVKGTTTLSVSGFATVPAGGKAFLSNLTVVESGSVYKLSVPEAREGYKFLGWADEEGNLYTNAKGVCLKAWDKDGDVVLVEKWEQIV